MGRTYRGERKVHGVTKTRHHKQRAKWKQRNGTRLRTLAVDILDFQQEAGQGVVPVHALASKETGITQQVLLDTPVTVLVIRRDYARKQVSHLQKSINKLKDLGLDSKNLSNRMKYWGSVVQSVGETLKEKSSDISASP